MRKGLSFLVFLMFIGAGMLSAEGQQDGGEYVRIAGGSPGSSVQVAGAGLAELINNEFDDIEATVVGSDGATANIRMTETGETEMGTGAATGLSWSVQGIQAFEGEDPYKDWRGVTVNGYVPLYGVTTKDKNITKLTDLKGKKVAMGPAGSGCGATWGEIMKEFDWEGDFRFMPFEEGNSRLKDGIVDAHLLGVRKLPGAVEAEAILGDRAVWFTIEDPELRKQAMDAMPALSESKMPADTFETQDRPLDVIGYSLWLIAHKSVPDEVVRRILDVVIEKGEEELTGYGAWGETWAFDLLPGFKDLESIGGKLHPGAIEYWENNGYDVPESIIP